MTITRRSALIGFGLVAAPAIIRTPGLLMSVKRFRVRTFRDALSHASVPYGGMYLVDKFLGFNELIPSTGVTFTDVIDGKQYHVMPG